MIGWFLGHMVLEYLAKCDFKYPIGRHGKHIACWWFTWPWMTLKYGIGFCGIQKQSHRDRNFQSALVWHGHTLKIHQHRVNWDVVSPWPLYDLYGWITYFKWWFSTSIWSIWVCPRLLGNSQGIFMDPRCAAGILQHRASEVSLAEVSKIQSPGWFLWAEDFRSQKPTQFLFGKILDLRKNTD